MVNALPNPFEFIKQLRYDEGQETLYQWFAAASMSVGSVATFVMMIGSIISFAQLSFANFVYDLTFPEMIPVVGGVVALPFLTVVTAVVSVPIAFGLINISEDKSVLYDDANGMMVFSAVTLLFASTQTAIEFESLLVSILMSVGVVYLGLYVLRVLNLGRRKIS